MFKLPFHEIIKRIHIKDVVLMSKRIDMTGLKYGRLTVISFYERTPSRRYLWNCKCECGNTVVVDGKHLRDGHTKSCGCYRVEQSTINNTTHGKTGTRIHTIWNSMRARCYCPTSHAYENYGGRGIKVCDEWLDFNNFYKWANENGWSEESVGISLDRIDVDGDYCPDNCRWASIIQQANNKRNNLRLTINGETKTINDWGRKSGIASSTIRHRIRSGWDVEKAVFEPVAKQNELIEFDGELHTLKEWSNILNINVNTLYGRLHTGWSMEDTLATPICVGGVGHKRKEVNHDDNANTP